MKEKRAEKERQTFVDYFTTFSVIASVTSTPVTCYLHFM